MPKASLAEKLPTFSDHGPPRIIAAFDDDVMVVKAREDFARHAHPGIPTAAMIAGALPAFRNTLARGA